MRRRGLSLVEVLVSIAISALLLTVFSVLYRTAAIDFSQGTSTIALSQTARQVVSKVSPYVSAAIPPGVIQGSYIYSPTGPVCSDQTNVYPNIYSLDFCSCVDFLNPDIDSRPDLVPGYSNMRGTGPHYRYRVRYDTSVNQLLLERIEANSPPTVPTLDNTVSPRILGRNLHRVSFLASGQGIIVRVSARTTDNQGNLQQGLTAPDGRTLNPDTTTDLHLQARSYELFTTVMIPYETAH